MSNRDVSNEGEIVPEDDAKQGRRGLRVFHVLIGSIVLAVVALIVVAWLMKAI